MKMCKWDLRLHSHYSHWSHYSTLYRAGYGDSSGQECSFGLYPGYYNSRRPKNNIWKMKILSKFETLHSHHPLKMKIAKVEWNTYFPSGKYLTVVKTHRGRLGRCCVCASCTVVSCELLYPMPCPSYTSATSVRMPLWHTIVDIWLGTIFN